VTVVEANASLIPAPGSLVVAGRYGKIGVEIQDARGSVAVVVNLVGAKRLGFLDGVRSTNARRGEPAHDAEREARELEDDFPAVLAKAHLFAAAPDMLAELEETAAWLEERAACAEQIADAGKRLSKVGLPAKAEAARLLGRAALIRQVIAKAKGGRS
jgi:hypothetical protein